MQDSFCLPPQETAVIIFVPRSEPKIFGGIDSYAIRMFECFYNKKIPIYWMHEDIPSIEPNLVSAANSYQVEEILLYEYSTNLHFRVKTCPTSLHRYDKIHIICLLDIFLLVLAYGFRAQFNKAIINIFLYVLHPYIGICVDKQIDSKRVAHKKLVFQFYRYLINMLHRNNNIIYMDELCRDYVLNYYQIPDINNNIPLARLGINVAMLDESLLLRKLEYETFTILSVARFDFPFKGYLLGLIDEFELIFYEHPKIRLSIIGNGSGEDLILRKIAEKPIKVRNAIKLYGKVNYYDLSQYFDKSHVFLGMGTTLLDATNHGLLAVVVDAYTFECKCLGLFSEHINILGSINNQSVIPARDMIRKIIEYDKREYIDKCLKGHAEFKKEYDINQILYYIYHLKNKNTNPLRIRICIFLIVARSYANLICNKLFHQ